MTDSALTIPEVSQEAGWTFSLVVKDYDIVGKSRHAKKEITVRQISSLHDLSLDRAMRDLRVAVQLNQTDLHGVYDISQFGGSYEVLEAAAFNRRLEIALFLDTNSYPFRPSDTLLSAAEADRLLKESVEQHTPRF